MPITNIEKSLGNFLNESAKFKTPAKERTIFSLGGRGYYENAASDLLAFFLRPNEEHGLGALFLSSLFECMGEASAPELSGVTIEREVSTYCGNRIDLQIDGGDWCLIVENKIWHLQNNPFQDYEEHANRRSTKLYFAILSPDGSSAVPDRWKGISYKDYCRVLRQSLGKAQFDTPLTKWYLFAREFILHLENEIYNPTMNTEQAMFFEEHENEFVAVKNLDIQYRKFLQESLKAKLDAKIPGYDFQPKEVSWPNKLGWAIRCYSNKWGQPNLAFWPQEGKFLMTVYMINLSENQLSEADGKFSGLKSVREGKSWVYWTTPNGINSREGAIDELCRLAAIVADLLPDQPEPTAEEVA